MLAVRIQRAGGPDVLIPEELELPEIKMYDVLIDVEWCGANRIDLDQRIEGKKCSNGVAYCPGLECSGRIIAVGKYVSQHKPSGRVCAILDGGGYADKVVVPANQVFEVPERISLKEAACFPEAACTIWQAFSKVKIERRKTILVHEACGYYAVFAMQMARLKGVRVFVATENDENNNFYMELGAYKCINWNDDDFLTQVQKLTSDRGGIEIILDSRGDHLPQDLEALCFGGVVVFLDMHGKTLVDVDIQCLMAKNAQIEVVDRAQNLDRKVVLGAKLYMQDAINTGLVKLHPGKCFQLSEANLAHRYMESMNIGQKMLSPLASWSPSLVPFVYKGMLAKDVKGKTLLDCQAKGQTDKRRKLE
ncbi:uncharacterized protein [Coffea arabica]|uniref:Quinone oxidoreductase-like isoform X1 n=1 Tax=Coffea arabica TaxID=13443 RepID=A0A6P6UGQ4_COFAR|nr:quinone oxidoreductase-like isoform X1 [Coffea arabica]XP_027089724.1 quinone oxidoreductase-like isoform X1 [Coffea arabica]XP_027089725.1 quinone oxidoreductase-like isoform X1 [Coffea arabica]